MYPKVTYRLDRPGNSRLGYIFYLCTETKIGLCIFMLLLQLHC